MVIRLNEQKMKGFYIDSKQNDIKIPYDFLENKAIPDEHKALFSLLTKYGIEKESNEIDEDDLASILDEVGVKLNQDLLMTLGWLEDRRYLKVENF